MSKATTGFYKGNPTISLDVNSRFPFSFGLAKANLILAHIDDIRAFVKVNHATAQPESRYDVMTQDQTAERIGA